MRRVKFYLNSGYVGAKREEIMEYGAAASDQDIEDDFQMWLSENGYAGWYEIEDDEE
jgi:hypothetical protein